MTTRISLSSIPPRFAFLGQTLRSLVRQDLRAPVEVWIPETYRRFPDWDGALPEVPPGVTIRRCPLDWGPATKVVPALLECLTAGDLETDILFCDDDSLYAPDFHRRFKELRAARPTEALAALGRHLPGSHQTARRAERMPRMRRLPRSVTRPILESPQRWVEPVPLVEESGYADLLGGWCGVMVRAGFFPAELRDGPGEWWPVDDVWLSAMLELAGTPIWVEASILPPTRRRAGGSAALALSEFEGRDRKALDLGCIEDHQRRFGLWSLGRM